MMEILTLNGTFLLKIVLMVILLIVTISVKNMILKKRPKHKKILLFISPVLYGLLSAEIFLTDIDRENLLPNLFYGAIIIIVLATLAALIDAKWFTPKD